MKKFMITMFFGLALSSCGVYLPQSSDIPLINKKNDLRIDAGVSSAGTAGTATVSYGISNNIVIQGYGNIGTNDKYFFQGAVGYYKNLNNRNVMEIYGGYGSGYGYSKHHDILTKYSGDYQTYFTQFNFGKLGNETSIWDVGLSIKPGLFHANLVKETHLLDGTEIILSEPFVGNSFFVEPSFFARIGDEHLKLSIKLGGLYIHTMNEGKYLPHFPINLGVGLNYRL